jgi:hypothetical protein
MVKLSSRLVKSNSIVIQMFTRPFSLKVQKVLQGDEPISPPFQFVNNKYFCYLPIGFSLCFLTLTLTLTLIFTPMLTQRSIGTVRMQASSFKTIPAGPCLSYLLFLFQELPFLLIPSQFHPENDFSSEKIPCPSEIFAGHL